jgi:uncharacterized protein YndB with AHSA1/START domain
MSTRTGTDRIEKTVILRAPVERVWRAITDSGEFGRWFGAQFDGPFAPGARVTATIRPTELDPEVAAQQEAYAGIPFVVWIETMEDARRFAFRWHPGGEPVDVANATRDQTTLVTFELEPVPEGTRLTIRETGFDVVPLERRAKALMENEEGWEMQARLITAYLARES